MPGAAFTPHAAKPIPHAAMCPQCQKPMGIVRIQTVGLGFDIRTVECSECKRKETVVAKRA
jgi:hypothetical protein